MSTPQKNRRTQPQKPVIPVKGSAKKKNFLRRSVPLYLLLLLTTIPVCTLGIYFHFATKKANFRKINDAAGQHDPNIKVVRGNGMDLVHPLLFVEVESEGFLDPLKTRINTYLEQKKQEKAFTSASVYLKDLNAGIYLNINPDSLYDPASIMKVPLLIIYLKQAETNPDLLKRSFQFTRSDDDGAVETIKDRSLTDGKTYTVEELLYYMIVYSDNESFWMLCDQIDDSKFRELDTELNIPHNIDAVHYPRSDEHYIANVNSVAHYFNVLYNASYLSKSMSAYALDLLTKCTYKNGIVREIDPGVIVAHKFGERTLSYMAQGRLVNLQTEFHEFGIVYLKGHPYLLGVMTRGDNSVQLQAMVSDISKIVYTELKLH